MLYFSAVQHERVQHGGMAEWTKAVVLKTIVAHATGGSNPSSSAFLQLNSIWGDAGVDDRGRLLSG